MELEGFWQIDVAIVSDCTIIVATWSLQKNHQRSIAFPWLSQWPYTGMLISKEMPATNPIAYNGQRDSPQPF